MRRTNVRRRVAVSAATLVLPASLVMVSGQAAQAKVTPGKQAEQLKDDLAELEKAESALKTQATAARSALTVGTAKWNASKAKLAAARKDAEKKTAQAKQARKQVEAKRRSVAQLAASSYQNPVDSSFAFASGVSAGDPMSQVRGMADVDQVGKQEATKLDRYRASRIASDVFMRQAKRSEREAASLERSLATQTVTLRAKAKKSTALLTKAAEKVDSLSSKISKLEAEERERLEKILEKKQAERLRELTQGGGGSGGGGGSMSCNKGNATGYANGLIPQSALCPLQGGWFLRADAARHFYQLNAAYRAQFGSDICVNSGYRPLQRQQELYQIKPPGYAAVPGTSNHGWGTAVDLGCGINMFGSVQHNWMRANAGKFGFIHPAWARSTIQEPWHWEYQG